MLCNHTVPDTIYVISVLMANYRGSRDNFLERRQRPRDPLPMGALKFQADGEPIRRWPVRLSGPLFVGFNSKYLAVVTFSQAGSSMDGETPCPLRDVPVLYLLLLVLPSNASSIRVTRCWIDRCIKLQH